MVLWAADDGIVVPPRTADIIVARLRREIPAIVDIRVMTQHLDSPALLRVAAETDCESLEQMRAEYLALIRPLRWRWLQLWLRNRIATLMAVAFVLYIVLGAIHFLAAEHRNGALPWYLIIPLAMTLYFILALSTSHHRFVKFVASWRAEETALRKELDMHLYTLLAIRHRHERFKAGLR